MEMNQFAIYQLKEEPKLREILFRPYQYLKDRGIEVRCENYRQVYIGRMQQGDTPEEIRKRLRQKLPNNFRGHSLSISDVLVLSDQGETTAYYVEKEGFKMIAGFIRNRSSASPLAFGVQDFQIEGKSGSWLVLDTIIIDGWEFFLMEHQHYGTNGTYVVLDADGKIVCDHNRNGFDDFTKQQIREYLHPEDKKIAQASVPKEEKPVLENWQKYMENGEYLRSAEISEEDNYNFIDGRKNNTSYKNKKNRTSVLAKLRRKQAEIAKRDGKPIPQMAMAEDMERRRK